MWSPNCHVNATLSLGAADVRRIAFKAIGYLMPLAIVSAAALYDINILINLLNQLVIINTSVFNASTTLTYKYSNCMLLFTLLSAISDFCLQTMSKISLLTMAMLAQTDTCLFMMHLTSSAVWKEAYSGFIAVGFLLFALCFYLEFPYLMQLWKVLAA